MLSERIRKEYNRLQKRINTIKKEMDGLPTGKLICSRGQNSFKWYISDGHNKTYLPKKDRVHAEKLAVKKYLSLVLEDLEHEKKALEFYLKHHFPLSEKAAQLLTTDSGYQELLSPYFLPKSKELSDWMNSPYEHNPRYSDQLIHKTAAGINVRSKSESLITLCLHTNQIPFRYECALHLGSATLYPDFTIRHPMTGDVYYWEHFGRMDDSSYVSNFFSKLQIYISHGIIPSHQLITTYETLEKPLSYEKIMNIIKEYFL